MLHLFEFLTKGSVRTERTRAWKWRRVGATMSRNARRIAADAIRIGREILSLACFHALISLHSNSCDHCSAAYAGPEPFLPIQ